MQEGLLRKTIKDRGNVLAVLLHSTIAHDYNYNPHEIFEHELEAEAFGEEA
jgi:hypothetical protein